MQTVYPAILTPDNGVVLVEVPDLSILTEGKDTSDAIAMARDAIELKCVTMQDDGLDLPNATPFGKVDIASSTFGSDESVVTLVDADLERCRKRRESRMVRRNVTIPAWMDREATAAKINVSRVLQDALAQALRA